VANVLKSFVQYNLTRSSADADKPARRVRGQSRSPNIVPFDMLGKVYYLCSIVTLSLKCAVFEIFDFEKCRNLETWIKGQSLKVIRSDTDRPDTYDFLLMFHSNHGPIWHRFRDKRRF